MKVCTCSDSGAYGQEFDIEDLYEKKLKKEMFEISRESLTRLFIIFGEV